MITKQNLGKERKERERDMGCRVRAGEQQKQGCHGKIHHFVV